ncbi:MAG: hypothetical protein OXQ89_10075 [Rhodospirillaceae bacterium]|nr:hypothetical protein [Rhodospirillaceae bacterium]MDD9998078.1 hypothetical protein [Rhodospirillaceae bacterium]
MNWNRQTVTVVCSMVLAVSALGVMIQSGFAEINSDIRAVHTRVNDVHTRINEVESGLRQEIRAVDDRVDGIDLRLDGIEVRLDGVEHRLDGIENRLTPIEIHLFGVEPEAALAPYAGGLPDQLAANACISPEAVPNFRVTASEDSPAAYVLWTIFAGRAA